MIIVSLISKKISTKKNISKVFTFHVPRVNWCFNLMIKSNHLLSICSRLKLYYISKKNLLKKKKKKKKKKEQHKGDDFKSLNLFYF